MIPATAKAHCKTLFSFPFIGAERGSAIAHPRSQRKSSSYKFRSFFSDTKIDILGKETNARRHKWNHHFKKKGEVKAINCTTTSNQLLSPSFLVYYFLLGCGEEERRDRVIGGAGLGDQEAAKYSKWARGGRGGGRGGGKKSDSTKEAWRPAIDESGGVLCLLST